ncbi:MAG: SLC13 family permease [Bacteroidota bacterium]|nr:SLC13 family permease [Bacteroidota bacterium]MDX5428318.1 SLC13 family permease [Bacteroidota bacterium]MDX5506095.1 SLC13 family permease [Bacteroidota bacterium]
MDSIWWTRGIVLLVLGLVMISLFTRRFRPTSSFVFGVLLLLITKVIEVPILLESFANKSILTIFLLIFLTNILRKHYNLVGTFDKAFGKFKSPRLFVLGMSGWVAILSSVINNTPIVSLMIPYVYEWGKRRNVSPSKLLMPMAYAATLGGMITVIGTSTNLVLNGLVTSNGFQPLGFLDFLVPGLLVTGAGIVYFAFGGLALLPDRMDLLEKFKKDTRSFIVETQLPIGSNLNGKTVEEAGLRNLKGMFLVEIVREGRLIAPVTPRQVLEEGDLLYFAGDVSQVVELVKEKSGLVLPKVEKYQIGDRFELVEALIPATSKLAGKKVRFSNFRERFDSAIIAIHRNGQRLGGKIGDVELAYGDLLLVSAGKGFESRAANSKDIYAVTTHHNFGDGHPVGKKAFGWIMLALVGLAVAGILPLFLMLLIGLAVAGAFDMIKPADLKKEFNIDLYLILVGALVLGHSLIDTGTAEWIANGMLLWLQPYGKFAVLLGLYVLTVLLTSFVTNVAAVAVVFPIAAGITQVMGLDPVPVFMTIAFGASAAFLTPVAYQTNLMVYGPGGYRGWDFLKFGLPLTIIYSLICVAYFANML